MPEPHYTLAAFQCPIYTAPSQSHLANNKLHNIRLALDVLEGTNLARGELFSFWDRIGEPTLHRGYKEGATFIHRQVTTTPGGGLCQISGLIYNLALLSDFQILERFPHSIDAYGENRYIPLGRDATVAFGKKDLRFVNTHTAPVVFHFSVTPELLSGQVTSPVPLKGEVVIEVTPPVLVASPLTDKKDPGLRPGETVIEPGLTGKKVSTFRCVCENGTEKRTHISTDAYTETPTLRRHGPVI